MGIIEKIKEVYNRQNFVQNKENWSFYRFLVFFFSVKGQKRVFRFIFRIFRFFWRKVFGTPEVKDLTYPKWRLKNLPSKKDYKGYKNEIEGFDYTPLISIIIPVYNPELSHFKAAIKSVEEQLYTNWEVCIADDCSTNEELLSYLKQLASKDKFKVTFREKNGHISASSNSAIALATGEYIALLDQDDLYRKDALYHLVKELNLDREIDFIYTDEDKINDEGEFLTPHFKPDWSPDNLLTRNYICHLACLKKSIVDKIGGFRIGFEGSQDHDLFLRATEHCNKIKHIPKVLYHWRVHENSSSADVAVKSYAIDSGVKAVQEAQDRRNVKAKVEMDSIDKGAFYKIRYELPKDLPKVSIIIPTKNNAKVLSTCLNSIFKLSSYPNFEVILIDNNSDEDSLFQLLNNWEEKEKDRFRVLTLPIPFNYSRLMNEGVKNSEGEYILLLNNDTEVIEADWIENMLRHAQRKDIGAVGVKLLYPTDRIQHAGVVIGMGEIAAHAFTGGKKEDGGYFHNLTSLNNYAAVTAACLMVSKEKYNEVEGFDETLAVEYNDVDFCLKLLDSGYFNLYTPEVTLYHYESLTRGHPHANPESYKRSRREVKYFKSRWQKYIDNDPFFNPNFSKVSPYFELNIVDF